MVRTLFHYSQFLLGFLARRLVTLLMVLVVLIPIKWLWYESFVLSASDIISDNAWEDLDKRRSYLLTKVARSDFGPEDMPSLVPSPFREELAIASLSMTAAALTNIAFLKPETRSESLQAVRTIIKAMLKEEIRRFEVLWWGYDSLDHLEDGRGQIGYLGHLNFVLGAYRLLGGNDEFEELHHKVTATLATRLKKGPGYHAETFPGLTFTADNTFVYVSLRHYDLIYGQTYSQLIDNWIQYTKRRLLDPDSGMVLYYVGSNGEPGGTPRGVLQAWNALWLPHIDMTFAREQYWIMKERLADRLAYTGFGGIREYARGRTGPTDGISGPIIAGISGSATGFAIGGAKWQRDEDFLTELLRTAELVGSTIEWNEKRFYLLAPLVGEAIVLTSMTVTRWDDRYLLHDM